MKTLFLLLAALVLVGCKTKIDTTLKVADKSFIVRTSEGELLRLPVAEIKGELVIDGKKPEKSFLKLYLRRNNKKFRPEIPLKLPHIDVLLGSNDPVRLDDKALGQSFGMMVMREIRPKDDRFIMTFHDGEFNNSIGEMIFEYEPSTVLFDENKKEFLASYQKVKRKQRAVVIRINGDVDGSLSMPPKLSWLEKTLDHIVNYGGAILISPWTYARYGSVNWIIGDSTTLDEETKMWKNKVKEYPVIDYFAFVHAGHQDLEISAEEMGLKKNQLRIVYTGACYSKHGAEWLTDYGAVAAAGQRALSASPIFQFTALRRWVYGFSFETALTSAYTQGAIMVKGLEFITFAKYWQEKTGMLAWKNVDDMLYSSEILMSYTKEVPAKNIYISQSAILSKVPFSIFEEGVVMKGVLEVLAESRGETIIDKEKVH